MLLACKQEAHASRSAPPPVRQCMQLLQIRRSSSSSRSSSMSHCKQYPVSIMHTVGVAAASIIDDAMSGSVPCSMLQPHASAQCACSPICWFLRILYCLLPVAGRGQQGCRCCCHRPQSQGHHKVCINRLVLGCLSSSTGSSSRPQQLQGNSFPAPQHVWAGKAAGCKAAVPPGNVLNTRR